MIVRAADLRDRDAIVALHIESWRASYRGLLPDDFLDGPVEPERVEHWQNFLTSTDADRITLIAISDDVLAGFVSVARSDSGDFDAYIEHLHVRPGLKGQGIGRRLLGEAARRLVDKGYRSAYLLVFDGNADAIGFYERLGGETRSFGMEERGGKTIPRSRIGWVDLAALCRACVRRQT